MPHPATQAIPILTVAEALGLTVTGRKARCFNGAAHKSGSDDTPALLFLTDVNRYKCYACGVQGDTINLVQAVKNVSFREAVAFLSDLTGVASSPMWVRRPEKNFTTRVPGKVAKGVYASLLGLGYEPTSTSLGGRYLASRGIGLEVADRFGVGELRDPQESWNELVLEYNEKELKAAGLVSKKGRFLFSRHRLLFFYYVDGRPQFIQARDITGKASCKELSVEGFPAPVPFNADVLREPQERILVCEGCIDTLSAAQLGYAAVGVPGVTGFREEWFPLFRNVRRVTILFDNDSAGQREATELRARFRMRRIKADSQFPSQGKDMNDLLKSLTQGEKHGAE